MQNNSDAKIHKIGFSSCLLDESKDNHCLCTDEILEKCQKRDENTLEKCQKHIKNTLEVYSPYLRLKNTKGIMPSAT